MPVQRRRTSAGTVFKNILATNPALRSFESPGPSEDRRDASSLKSDSPSKPKSPHGNMLSHSGVASRSSPQRSCSAAEASAGNSRLVRARLARQRCDCGGNSVLGGGAEPDSRNSLASEPE